MTKTRSLSDVARQNNSARVSKFASSIIPAAPEETPNPAPSPEEPPAEVIQKAETGPVDAQEITVSAEELRSLPAVAPQTPASKPVRKPRSGGALTMEEIINPKAPEEESFAKMTRIAEKHHELLREIAFKHRKPMNTILYNLLEALDQTYQREQQNHA